MPSDTEDTLPAAEPTAKRPRGRPPAQSATETHHQRIARLQDELRQAQEALKMSEERRAAVIGHACLRHARHNAEFARHLAAALRAEVKAKADRAAVADLMNDSPAAN